MQRYLSCTTHTPIDLTGEDTSSNTSAWTLFLVSQHPEVEAKLVAELEQAGLLATPQQPEPRALAVCRTSAG